MAALKSAKGLLPSRLATLRAYTNCCVFTKRLLAVRKTSEDSLHKKFS